MSTPIRPKMTRKQSLLHLFHTPLTPLTTAPLSPESISAPTNPVVLLRSYPTSPCPLCGPSDSMNHHAHHAHHAHQTYTLGQSNQHQLGQSNHHVLGPTERPTMTSSASESNSDEDPHAYRRRAKPTMSKKKMNELNHLALSMAPLTPEIVRTSTRVQPSPPTPPTESLGSPTASTKPSRVFADLPRIPSLTMTDLSASTGSLASIASVASTIMGSMVIQEQGSGSGSDGQVQSRAGGGGGGGGSDTTASGGDGNGEHADAKPRLVHYDSAGRVQSVWNLAFGEDEMLAAAAAEARAMVKAGAKEEAKVKTTDGAGDSSRATVTTIQSSVPSTSSTIAFTGNGNAPTVRSRTQVHDTKSTYTSSSAQITTLITKAETLLEHADILKSQLADRKKEDTSEWGYELKKDWEKDNRRIKREIKAVEQETEDWFTAVMILIDESEAGSSSESE